MTIKAEGYSLYVTFLADQSPKIFLGIASADGQQRDIQGAYLSRVAPGSGLAHRAGYVVSLRTLGAIQDPKTALPRTDTKTTLDSSECYG
jgi:hypothetical protein